MQCTYRIAFVGLAFFLVARTPVLAQEQDDFDPKKVVQEISADLEKILKGMSSLTGTGDQAAGQRVVENIDKLLDEMKDSQGKIVSNIDELIKNLKQSPNGGGGGGGGQDQKSKGGKSSGKQGSQSKSDRNQKDGEDGRNPSGQKPKSQSKDGSKDGEKDGEKPEDGMGDGQEKGGENPKDPKQSKSGRKPKDPNPEKFTQDAIKDAWGFLPSETRQKLIEGNFKDFFPNYDKEIKEYLKSLNKK